MERKVMQGGEIIFRQAPNPHKVEEKFQIINSKFQINLKVQIQMIKTKH